MEHGGYILPENVPANEFLNLEGQKLSTSRNWAVWLHEYLEDFPGKNDELRYTLTSIAPETKDSDFTWKDYQLKVNSELVAILGNFVNRVMVLCQKYFDGSVPKGYIEGTEPALLERSKALKEQIDSIGLRVNELVRSFKFRDAQAEWLNIAREGNRFLAETEPWKRWKTDPDQVQGILLDALHVCARLAATGEPFLPETARRIMKQLNLVPGQWKERSEKWEQLSPGHSLGEPFLLFEQIEDAAITMQTERLSKSLEQQAVSVEEPSLPAEKAEIQYEDFAKMDIRVGTILEAVKVPKADKLLQLTIDTGMDVRTVVSGIAEHYTPEQVIGQQVCILVNLAPRKLRGIESQGMILMAESNGKLLFVQPNTIAVPGSTVA
jgi:methionyl-tRNA synthetase